MKCFTHMHSCTRARTHAHTFPSVRTLGCCWGCQELNCLGQNPKHLGAEGGSLVSTRRGMRLVCRDNEGSCRPMAEPPNPSHHLSWSCCHRQRPAASSSTSWLREFGSQGFVNHSNTCVAPPSAHVGGQQRPLVGDWVIVLD